jgi:hypothetical protein
VFDRGRTGLVRELFGEGFFGVFLLIRFTMLLWVEFLTRLMDDLDLVGLGIELPFMLVAKTFFVFLFFYCYRFSWALRS